MAARIFATRYIPQLNSQLRNWSRKIDGELKVIQRARDDGRDNLPLSTDTTPDATQRSIEAYFAAGRDQLQQFLTNAWARATDEIVALVPGVRAAGDRIEGVEADLARALEARRDGLIDARLDARRAERDLKHFRRETHRVRDAVYATNIGWPIVLLLFILFLEAGLNTVSFAEVSPSGIMGGLIQALIFGAGNVMIGVSTGLIFRGVNLITPLWRWARGGISLVMAAAGLFWNLATAHYRDLIAAQADQIAEAGWGAQATQLADVLFSRPFAIESLQGWGLFVFGLIFFGVAAYEGYCGFADTYPGYAKVTKRSRSANEDFNVLVADLDAEEARIIGALQTACDGEAANADAATRTGRVILQEAKTRRHEVADSAADLQRACATSLRRYREENLAVRMTPPPPYYSDYPELAATLPEAGDDLPAAFDRLADAAAAAGQVAAEVRRRMAGLSAETRTRRSALIADIDAEVDQRFSFEREETP